LDFTIGGVGLVQLLNIVVRNNYESVEKSEFYNANKNMSTH